MCLKTLVLFLLKLLCKYQKSQRAVGVNVLLLVLCCFWVRRWDRARDVTRGGGRSFNRQHPRCSEFGSKSPYCFMAFAHNCQPTGWCCTICSCGVTRRMLHSSRHTCMQTGCLLVEPCSDKPFLTLTLCLYVGLNFLKTA